MATTGIKRIHIHNVGKEGIDNSVGLKDIDNLNIAHPIGINDENSLSNIPSGSGALEGGTYKYPIFSNTKRENSHLLNTETEKGFKIIQNVYEDIFFTASIDPDRNHIPTLWIADSDAERYTTSSVQAYQWAFQSRGRTSANADGIHFKNHVSGNEAGWWVPQASNEEVPPYFELKELPNTTFKVTLDLWFQGKNADSSPLTESIYAGVFNQIGGNMFSTLEQFIENQFTYPLSTGYLPVQKVLVSASANVYQNHTFEFMVTQSYSRIYDKPIGPTYTQTYYRFRGLNQETSQLPKWYINVNGDWDWNSEHSSSKELMDENPYRSTIKIEPITLIKNDTNFGTDSGGVYSFIGNTGSVVQPPTTTYQNLNLSAGSDITSAYNAGDVVDIGFVGGILVPYDNLGSLNYGNLIIDVASLAQNIILGRFIMYEKTGALKNSLWSQYTSWRYQSLVQTSSIIPIDNTIDNYAVSEYNPLINNGGQIRKSAIYYDLDYTRGIDEPVNIEQVKLQSAVKAPVVDSNYSSRNWTSLRYNGSRISSPGINQT